MSIIQRISSMFSRKGENTISKRSFAAAQISRLRSTWTTTNLSGDAELRGALRVMRARARELSRNNDYAKKFIRMVMINTLGHNGIILQSKAKLPNGKLDETANDAIEAAWREWGIRINNPEVTGRFNWRGIQRMVARSLAREGESLIRIVRGYPNKCKFALQFIDVDHLNEDLNEHLSNGNKIKMGVEVNQWGKPVAYHISTTHPGDYIYPAAGHCKVERIPAEDIIHVFDPDRIGDSRGLTPMHTAMTRMNMLGGYEEAELVAARIAAAKMGFYKTKDGEYVGDDEDTQGNFITEADPGTFEVIPQNYELETFDPQHPAGNFPPFVKQMLRGMASGLGVSYNSLASDLESVNYSSIRSGTLEERDNWRDLQAVIIENFHEIVYAEWLKMWLTVEGNKYGLVDFSRLYAPKWTARSWAWVDPLKDQRANLDAIEGNLNTYTDVLAEQGKDFEEHIQQLKYEAEVFKAAGIEIRKDEKNKEASNNDTDNNNGE